MHVNRGVVVLGGVMGAFILLVFAAIFAVTFHRTYQAQSWPETQCEIFDARAEDDPDDDGSDWDVMISWRYQVDAVHYEHVDDDPAVFGIAWDREEADALLTRFAPGSTVPCYYDPDDPRESVLDRSAPPWSAIVFAGVVAAALLAGLIGLAALLVRKLSSGS